MAWCLVKCRDKFNFYLYLICVFLAHGRGFKCSANVIGSLLASRRAKSLKQSLKFALKLNYPEDYTSIHISRWTALDARCQGLSRAHSKPISVIHS
jgi:hypothetical protein